MFGRLRSLMTTVLTPVARLLLRLGVTPDAVTIAGTVVVTALALTLLPAGHLLLGGLLIGFFALLDSLDGVLARLSGRTSSWGAFLDSTLDRVSDGAVFAGITLYFVLHPDVPHATWGTVAALACLAASLVWVAQRTSTIADDGVPLLAWTAFGTVSAVFFLVPMLLGDLIRVRIRLRAPVTAA
jgi:CDP-diacylglycerol--glycerol-3-phosphate 3-phosphatidyltransferase